MRPLYSGFNPSLMDYAMANNKRRFQRIPFDAHVQLKLMGAEDNSIINGLLNDISLKGALIAVADDSPQLKVGQTGVLSIVPEQSGLNIVLNVEVAYQRTDQHWYGVNILSFDVDSASHLRRLIEVNLGDDSSLKRELGNLVEAMEQEHTTL